MGEASGLIEKESSAFANNSKPRLSASPRGFGSRGSVSAGVKLSDADQVLERTLVNSTDIGENLTKREAEIMRLIVAGKTNKKIAQILCRTQRTIEYHRNRLMHKLKVHNVAGLVKRAIAMGIILPPSR